MRDVMRNPARARSDSRDIPEQPSVADAYGELDSETNTIAPLLRDKDIVLTTPMNIQEAARAFERTEAEALAVVDLQRRVVGLLTEAYVLRRYADESERRRREILGEV